MVLAAIPCAGLYLEEEGVLVVISKPSFWRAWMTATAMLCPSWKAAGSETWAEAKSGFARRELTAAPVAASAGKRVVMKVLAAPAMAAIWAVVLLVKVTGGAGAGAMKGLRVVENMVAASYTATLYTPRCRATTGGGRVARLLLICRRGYQRKQDPLFQVKAPVE